MMIHAYLVWFLGPDRWDVFISPGVRCDQKCEFLNLKFVPQREKKLQGMKIKMQNKIGFFGQLNSGFNIVLNYEDT